MNVLLTSVGRRNYLVDYFKNAIKPYGGKVYAINSDLNSSAMFAADFHAQAPLIYDDLYPDFILDYCIKNKINLVFSLFDIELPRLAILKYTLSNYGITAVVGDEWLTNMANDKWETQSFLLKNGFNCVPTYISLEKFKRDHIAKKVNFPVFVKPRWGMGSISVNKSESIGDVEFYFRKTHLKIKEGWLKFESSLDESGSVLIQESLPGVEFGLDVINDLEGNHQITVVKQKLSMRAGETDCAITVKQPALEELGEQLARLTKHPGNMDVDVFFDGKDAFVLELNPRFGGGYPFSHQAGIDLPSAIIEWYNGTKFNKKKYFSPKIGVLSMKGVTMVSSF